MSDYPPPKFTGYFSNYLFNITTYKLESYCQMGRHEKAKKCAINVVIYSFFVSMFPITIDRLQSLQFSITTILTKINWLRPILKILLPTKSACRQLSEPLK